MQVNRISTKNFKNIKQHVKKKVKKKPENKTSYLKSSWSECQWFYIGQVKQPAEYNETMHHRSMKLSWIADI
jgi:hypothetical protein